MAGRGQFVPQMVSGLMKLGLPQNAQIENRRLSLDLVGLIIHWEQRRIADSEPRPSPVQLFSSIALGHAGAACAIISVSSHC